MSRAPDITQSPSDVAFNYGSKPKIAQAVQNNIVHPTVGQMAAMLIDRIVAAEIQPPTETVRDKTFAPPQGPQGGPPPQGAPQGGPPPGAPPMQMASAAPPPQGGPPPQGPVGMAEGGLTSLPVPDYMFDEQTFAGGGIVAFAKGSPGEVEQDSFWSKVGQLPSERRKKGAPSPTDRERNSYRDYARGRAAAMGLDPNFVDQLFLRESKYDPYAMSGTGPRGIAQFTGATGKAYGLETKEDRFDPKKSIDAALAHISDLAKKYNSDATKIAVAYNQGETALNRNLNENRGVLNLDAFKDPQVKPYVAAVAGGKGTGGKQIASVTAPQTQMARNEPPAPALQRVAQSVLPGIPSAYGTAPQNVQTSALTPSRADRAMSALNAINPIGTAQAAETNKPQAAPKGPYPDVMNNPEYNPMVEPTIMPSTIDPGRKLSNAEVLKRAVGSATGAGIVNYFTGLGNIAMTPQKVIAAGVNATDRFLNMPRGYNDVPPEAPRTPGKLTGPNNYSRENDPMLKRMLGGNTPAPVAAPVAAPVMAAGPAKETSEEALARILLDNKRQNALMTAAQAGFGMMAGTSPNALTNIGAGLSAAMPGFAAANRSDQELALKQQELAQQRDMNEKQLAAQTPTALQYARSQVNLFKSKTPNPTASQIEEVFSKAVVEYPRLTEKTTGMMTPDQAMRRAQDASITGDIPRGPDGKKLSVGQYAQQLMSQYGSGGLGGANLGIQDYTSFFSG